MQLPHRYGISRAEQPIFLTGRGEGVCCLDQGLA
jgi:hypothetical protein